MPRKSGKSSGAMGHATNADYQVGYGRPPVATRFKPGKSGNPRGRPPGRRDLSSIVDQILDKTISVREGGRIRNLTGAEAFILSLFNKALQGQPRAATLWVDVLGKMGRIGPERPQSDGAQITTDDQDLIDDFLRRKGFQPTFIPNNDDDIGFETKSTTSREGSDE